MGTLFCLLESHENILISGTVKRNWLGDKLGYLKDSNAAAHSVDTGIR